MRDVDRIKADPRVKRVYKDPPDGWWLETKPGFSFDDNEQHTTSEQTIRELRSWLRRITPCQCDDCRKLSG